MGEPASQRVRIAALVACYAVALASGLWQARTHPGPGAVGWYFSGLYAYPYGSAVAAEQLPSGSRMLRLNGLQVEGLSTDAIAVHLRTRPGEINRLHIRRPDGGEATVLVPVEPFTWRGTFTLHRTRLLLGAALVAVALAAFAVRPYTLTAWALVIFCVILAINLFMNDLLYYPTRPLTFAIVYEAFASGLVTVTGMHLALVFPVLHPAIAQRPWRILGVYAVGLGLGGVALAIRLDGHLTRWTPLAPFLAASLFYLLGRSARLAARSADLVTRQRARVLLGGAVVGFAPTVLLMLGQNVLNMRWLDVRSVLWTMFAFPLALAYLTVRWEAVNARIARRRTLAYGAAASTVAGLAWGVATAAARLTAGAYQITAFGAWCVGLGVAGALAAAAWRPFRDTLDRWFYPKRAAYPEILARLRRDLAGCASAAEVLACLTRAPQLLCDAGGGTAFLFPNGNAAGLLVSSEPLEQIEVAVLAQTVPMRWLKATGKPLRLDLLASEPAYANLQGLAEVVFDRLRATVVLPISRGGRVVGGLAVGPRASGDVYESAELRALAGLLAQAGSVLAEAPA